MSTWNAQNLLKRMREVTESAAGTLRTISSGTLKGNLPAGLDLNEEARRGLIALTQSGSGVPCESRVVSVKRSPASPPVIGNLALYDVEAETRVVYPFTTLGKLTDATRDAFAGVAATHGEAIVQAFTYPGNLLQTNASGATGLISGMFAHVDSSYEWRGRVEEAGTLEARHRFKGVVSSAPATS